MPSTAPVARRVASQSGSSLAARSRLPASSPFGDESRRSECMAIAGTVPDSPALSSCWCAPQMEDAMCYTRDYKHFEEQQKKADTKFRQERQSGLINTMLDD